MAKRRKSFTLIELLVAVGLLSLIMMLLFQLFSGAQKIWVASEKTNNVYADARVAMDLMADILNTVQFSCGEKIESGKAVRDYDKDMIFSLTTGSKTTDSRYSSSIYFVSKTARELPKKINDTRFISFQLGSGQNAGKLLMLIYSDEAGDAFYNCFPGENRKRNTILTQLKSSMPGTASGESENCQVIAENVVSFKLAGYTPNGSGKLEEKTDTDEDLLKEPPYMIEIRLTVLDPDSYRRWQELPDSDSEEDTPAKNYLKQHQRTFTRSVFIGDRWALAKETLKENAQP